MISFAIQQMKGQLDEVNRKLSEKEFTTDETKEYLLGVRNSTVYHLQLLEHSLELLAKEDRSYWQEYVSELKNERRYWQRRVNGKSVDALLNQSYSRGKLNSLEFAIDQANFWRKGK